MVDNSGSRAEAARTLLDDGGLSALAGGVKREARRAIPGVTDPPHQAVRTDIETRWQRIETVLQSDDRTVLDIGCNAGYITERIASSGRFAIGVDVQAEALSYTDHDTDRLALARMEVAPDTMRTLPSVDAVLCLSVIQQWSETYGPAAATEMTSELATLGDRIIVELPPSKTQLDVPYERDDDESQAEYYRSVLSDLFHTDVECLGQIPTAAAPEEPRLLFHAETNDTGSSQGG